MKNLSTLLRFFPSGTTEGERSFLDRAFIKPTQLAEIIRTPPGNPRILVGRKGVGKTAVLEWLYSVDRKHGIPALLIRPDDLDTSSIATAIDVASLKRGMYDALLKAVADSIGSQLSGFLTGAEAQLYQGAVSRNQRDPDWGTKLLQLISGLAKPVTEIDGAKLAQSLEAGTASPQITEAVNEYLRSEKRTFMVLIDDTDQISSPSQPDHQNRIWALLLAIRKLSQLNPCVRCIVSLRTEVWMRLTRNERGQRDQIDHFRPLLLTLRTDEFHMLSILRRRFELACQELEVPTSKANFYFFQSKDVRLPTSEERRAWNTFILKCSRERPRDMIQLVSHLARRALSRQSDSISDADAESAMTDYSRERAEDLAIEMGDSCAVFLDVIRAFGGAHFEMPFEELRQILRRLPSRFGIMVNGIPLQPEQDDSVLTLLGLLHEADFINAKIEDSKQSRGFRHISFLDDPHLVKKSRWNELQSLTWEIHPAFRTYLLGLRK